MTEWRVVVAGGGVALTAAIVGFTVPVPEALWPLAGGGLLAVGFGCGFVAGRRSAGGWRSRTHAGALAGLLGGVVLASALWASMANVLPRADDSVFWLVNRTIAATPVGIERLPWLYTGNTLFWPLLVLFAGLFVIEGYVASGLTNKNFAAARAR